MSIGFVWYRPNGKDVDSGSVNAVMEAAKRRVDTGQKYTLTVDGEAIGSESVSRDRVLDHLRRRLQADGEAGHTYRVNPEGDAPVSFKVRTVDSEPPHVPVTAVNGNAKANAFWQALNDEFAPLIDHQAGSYVCKPDSQHRFGNALDVFFKSFADQEKAAAWSVANADRLSIEHVISGDRIWTRGVGWHPYTGEYHAHLHVDYSPNFDQSLPCGLRP